jgi:hypothetical protein
MGFAGSDTCISPTVSTPFLDFSCRLAHLTRRSSPLPFAGQGPFLFYHWFFPALFRSTSSSLSDTATSKSLTLAASCCYDTYRVSLTPHKQDTLCNTIHYHQYQDCHRSRKKRSRCGFGSLSLCGPPQIVCLHKQVVFDKDS